MERDKLRCSASREVCHRGFVEAPRCSCRLTSCTTEADVIAIEYERENSRDEMSDVPRLAATAHGSVARQNSGIPASDVSGVAAMLGDSEMLPDGETREKRRRRNAGRQAVEWAVLIVGAVVLALVIRGTLIQAFYIPSESMEPTLHGCSGCNNNDRILVNKLSYKFHDVNRGDIVVFTTPPAETNSNIKDLVKRVVALPGETIETRNDAIYITKPGRNEAQQLDEPYINPACKTSGAPYNNNLTKQTVPAGMYFVMGDNRCQSHDSRYFGPIKADTIVGRAFVRIWPLSRFKFL